MSKRRVQQPPQPSEKVVGGGTIKPGAGHIKVACLTSVRGIILLQLAYREHGKQARWGKKKITPEDQTSRFAREAMQCVPHPMGVRMTGKNFNALTGVSTRAEENWR